MHRLRRSSALAPIGRYLTPRSATGISSGMTSALLRRNLWIYGLGGIIAPFVGIKLLDLIIHNLFGA